MGRLSAAQSLRGLSLFLNTDMKKKKSQARAWRQAAKDRCVRTSWGSVTIYSEQNAQEAGRKTGASHILDDDDEWLIPMRSKPSLRRLDSVLMLSGPAHSANGTMLCAEVAHKLFHMAHWKTDANIQSKLTKLTEAQRTFSLCWNLKNVRSAISDPTASVQEAC